MRHLRSNWRLVGVNEYRNGSLERYGWAKTTRTKVGFICYERGLLNYVACSLTISRYTFLEVCASLGGGVAQIATGIWADYKGFFPPSVFIVFMSVVALILTLTLKTNNATDSQKSHSEDANLEVVEETSIKKQRKKSECSSAICSQLRAVIRIYTSNSINCEACKGSETISSSTYILFLYIYKKTVPLNFHAWTRTRPWPTKTWLSRLKLDIPVLSSNSSNVSAVLNLGIRFHFFFRWWVQALWRKIKK